MSRLLLVGLDEAHVDVLSLLKELDPKPEILVVHADPEALVMKLADLAELPTTTALPSPREGDTVIMTGNGSPRADLEPWRQAGATFVEPKDFGKPSTKISKEDAMDFKTHSDTTPSPPPTSAPPRPVPSLSPRPANTPPAEIWVHPEATFRYLVDLSGPDATVTLWGDAGTGVWVPWVWTGEAPTGRAEDVGAGIEIPCPWGSFRLLGADGRNLNLEALGRVAEDLALRDLAAWRHASLDLVSLGFPDPSNESTIEPWADKVLTPLHSEAALIWIQEADTWKLLTSWGEGLVFNGDLIVSESLFAAIFDSEGAGWFRWDLGDGLCVQFMRPETDPSWPLRFHRMKLAMAGEVGGW